MGLDVYLYWEKSRELIDKHENKVEQIENEAWKSVTGDREYDSLSESERDAGYAAQKQALSDAGLDSDVPKGLQRKIEISSTKYPDHLFKIGYFRSSYNDGGINSVLGTAIGISLYDIFGVDNKSGYIITPEWEEAKENTVSAISKYKLFLEGSEGFVTDRVQSPVKPLNDESEVMAAFIKQYHEWNRSKDKRHFSDYSNASGTFTLKGEYKIYAVFNVPAKFGMGVDTILVTKRPADWTPESDWYYTALQIVLETIEWVLSQPDKEQYVLHWSS
jgi:hypothetical protein